MQAQGSRQGDGSRDDGAVGGVQRRGGVGEGREDGVGADEGGGEGPGGGVRGEVAEEDVDEEGLLQGVFGDADVGDPFRVVRCGGVCCCGGCGRGGEGGGGGGGCVGGDFRGERGAETGGDGGG